MLSISIYTHILSKQFFFHKGKNDYQTEADRSAQQCIIKSLERQFPSITIIGEEEQSSCDVPHEWIVTESEPDILSLDCPEETAEH